MATTEVNVGTGERWASGIVGGALALYGLTRRSIPGALLATAGAALLYRGVGGHCPLYGALDIDTSGQDDVRSADDVVQSASEESFPASDPPAWTPTTSFVDRGG